MDVNLKPEVWGWVCLQRRGDEKPRLVRIPTAMVTKTKNNSKFVISQEMEMSACHNFPDCRSQHHHKNLRDARKITTSKVTGSSWSRKKKHLSNSKGSRHSVQDGSMFECKEDMVTIPSSADNYTTKLLTGRKQKQDKSVISRMKK